MVPTGERMAFVIFDSHGTYRGKKGALDSHGTYKGPLIPTYFGYCVQLKFTVSYYYSTLPLLHLLDG